MLSSQSTITRLRQNTRHGNEHEDRDEVKRLAEADFLNLYMEHGGTQRWKSLKCLFHQDSRPSASIFRGRFYCFGCGVDLDVFEFIQRIRGEDFKGALAFLAARYNVPLNRPMTEGEKRDYARRRAAAEQEANELVSWKLNLLTVLRDARNTYLAAYHRTRRYITRHGLDASAGNLAADACELYEARYQDLDERIERLDRANFDELLPLFRGRGRYA
jgi:DNA primase